MKRDKRSEEKSVAKTHIFEGTLVLIAAMALYFFVALITYHNSDPGWSSSGTGQFVANAGGKVGAWISDFLYSLFGYIAFIFPIVFLGAAAKLFQLVHSENYQYSFFRFLVRAIGFILLLISLTGLFGIYFSAFAYHLPYGSGGVFGRLVDTFMPTIFNFIGTELLLFTLFFVGLTLLAGLSWLVVFDAMGVAFIWLLNFVLDNYSRWQENRNATVAESQPIYRPKREKVTEKKTEPNIKQKPTILINRAKKKEQAAAEKQTFTDGDLPSLELLDQPKRRKTLNISHGKLEAVSKEVEAKLLDFGIEANVVEVHPGPVITRFELELAPGLKASKLTVLSKDLARSLSVSRVRIVEVIPGKSVVGLELPNESIEMVAIRSVLETSQYQESTSPISLALGKDISGSPVVVDLAKMPHLLVAGTTGSGKSVSLNVMLLSMLYKSTPEEVRFIMVDPKMLELSIYDGIPHLLTPVVTNMKEAANAFRWCVAEMERRYRLMASLGVRNLAGYNAKVKKAIDSGNAIIDPLVSTEEQIEGEEKYLETLPNIVVVVDELADMMMIVGKKVEELIARIAQKARAAGIHMILATQRPSVDVITGLIKSNIPTRIAFQVSSKIDSRTILDQQGAEQLLGNGDMLYLPAGIGLPVRVHGAYVSDAETKRVVNDLKKRGRPEYCEEILQGSVDGTDAFLSGESENGADGEQDPFYDQAVAIVTESRRASISYVQRRLKIGFNRAARILEDMEAAGVVSEMNTNGSREVIAPPPVE